MKPQTQSNRITIGLSTNQLVVFNKVNEDYSDHKILLEGDDNNLAVIEGPTEIVIALIDTCFNARDFNALALINLDDGIIRKFK